MTLLENIKQILYLIIKHRGDSGEWCKWARRFAMGIDQTKDSAMKARNLHSDDVRWDAADAAFCWAYSMDKTVSEAMRDNLIKHAESQVQAVYSALGVPLEHYSL